MLSKTGDRQITVRWTAEVSPTYVLSLLSALVSSIIDAKLALAHEKTATSATTG
ncbi:hypothetical protein SODG_001085 [Sodalis praecaptivus]